MAGDNPIETRVGSEPVRSVELGMPTKDGSRPVVKSSDGTGSGTTAQFDDDGVTTHRSDQNPERKERPDGQEGGAEGDQDAERSEGQEGSEGEGQALPEFKADSAEVVAAYNQTYFQGDQPRMEAFSADWWKSAKRNADGSWSGSLPDDTYKFLETKGYSKEFVKELEAGQLAIHVQREQAVYTRAGGADRLSKALAWAKGGGYTEAQKERYNASLGNNETALDAVDLLMTRWS